MYEIELEWDGDGDPLTFRFINHKWVFGFDVHDVRSNYSQMGYDGVQLQGTDKKWIKLPRTRPQEFAFKNNISFNRYIFLSKTGKVS